MLVNPNVAAIPNDVAETVVIAISDDLVCTMMKPIPFVTFV